MRASNGVCLLGSCSMGYPTAKITAAKIREFLEVNEPEVIIECPSCQTRFRIEASKLSSHNLSPSDGAISSGSGYSSSGARGPGHAKARFHCSRCDYIFSAEVATNNMGDKDLKDNFDNQAFAEINSDEKTPIIQNNEFNTDELEGVANPELSSSDTDSSSAAVSSSTEDFLALESASDARGQPFSDQHGEQLSFNFDTPAVDPANRIDRKDMEIKNNPADFFASSTELSAPEVEATRVVDEDTPFEITDFSSSDVAELSKSSSEEQEVNFNNLEAQGTWSKPDSETYAGNEDFSRYAQDFDNYSAEPSELPDNSSANLPNEEGVNREPLQQRHTAINKYYQPSSTIAGLTPEIYSTDSAPKQRMSPLSTLALLLLPLIVCLALLGASTLYLRNNLKASEKLLTSLFPGAAREAPSGVFIQQPKLETVVLDSGDVVNVVTGTVVNQSKKILTALTIEALGFSDSGKIITTERISAGNPISSNNATIKTLTPSNIKELQSKEAKNFILRPDTKMRFTLVFTRPVRTSGEDANIASFATRVFSARFRTE